MFSMSIYVLIKLRVMFYQNVKRHKYKSKCLVNISYGNYDNTDIYYIRNDKLNN